MILHAIIVGEKAKAPLHYVEYVQAFEGRGLEGDRYFFTSKAPLTSHSSLRM